jgi:hypothetical protein
MSDQVRFSLVSKVEVRDVSVRFGGIRFGCKGLLV